MADNSLYDYVNKNAKIKDVISYFLGEKSLIRNGNNYKALCPFHHDHDPSMSISVDRNIYKCFSCGEGGGPITFAQKYLKITSFEAIKKVIEICHLTVPSSYSLKERKSEVEVKYVKELNALKELSNFYSLFLTLPEGKGCLEYLEKRKIDKEMIDEFSLGYAPIDKSLSINSLIKRNIDIQTMQNAGILGSSVLNEDRFSNRLIFPLKDEDGNIVAFAGRQLVKDDSTGKYINYPETLLFHKGDLFYNMDKAKSVAYSLKYIYIVEGYMDTISMYKAGIKNTVACMTSTINENQMKILKRMNVQIRLLLDSDSAGQNGTLKNLLPLLKNHLDVQVVQKFDLIKEGKDPDEVLDRLGKDYLVKRVNKLLDPFIFVIFNYLNGRKTLTSSFEIKTLIRELKPYYFYLDDISKVKDIEALARVTSLSTDDLIKQFTGEIKITSSNTDNSKKYTRYKRKDELIKEEKMDISSKLKDESSISVIYKTAKKLATFCYSSSSYKCKVRKNILQEESSIILQIFNYYEAYLTLQESLKKGEDDKFEFSYFPFYYLNLILRKLYEKTPTKIITKEIIDDFINNLKENSTINNDDSDDPFIEINPYQSVIDQLKLSNIPMSFLFDILNIIKDACSNRSEFAKKDFVSYLLKTKNEQEINVEDLKKPATNLEEIQKKFEKMKKINSKK